MQKTKQKVKVLILGESGVGKSSILQRFIEDKFSYNFSTTLGVDYKQKEIKLQDQDPIMLQVWDTAGQERFNTIPSIYYKSVDGVIFVYDLSENNSFNNITYWISKLKDNSQRNGICGLLVGNKNDCERKVLKSDVEILANSYGMIMQECSAKANINIDLIFNTITSLVVNQRKLSKQNQKQTTLDSDKVNLISTENSTNKSQNNKCCCK